MSSFDQLVTFLPVQDLDAAHSFYSGALGLAMVLDQGQCRVYRATTTSFIGVCVHLEPRPAEGVITTLVTEDVDGWYQRLQSNRAGVAEAPQFNQRFGIYHFFVEDPDGNRLEIQRFEGPGIAGDRDS